MGFPWFTETDSSGVIDWIKVSKSFDKYFARLNKVGCCVIFEESEVIDEIFVFEYKDMKFPNEDNWGDING